MGSKQISYKGRGLIVHSAVSSPDFAARPVLCGDPWEYVRLWLRRKHMHDAIFYWDQARQFYIASTTLPETASPLTSYYCFLNATKALLEAKKRTYSDYHGVTGRSETGRRNLRNEIVQFKEGGVLAELRKFLGDPFPGESELCLYDIFYHLPFLHRAFTLTYKSATELFIPLDEVIFVKKERSSEAWTEMVINPRYVNSATERVLPRGYERDVGSADRFVCRRRSRFKWEARKTNASLERLRNYHRMVRKEVIPIFSSKNSWYLRKDVEMRGFVDKSQMVLMYAGMHRLSEIARYDPLSLSGHLELQHNWLLAEFLRVAPAQFIHNVSSEITGLEFVEPYAYRAQ